MTQLDLFVHYQPKAQLITFPTGRHVTMAQDIAQQLDALDFENGKKRWQAVCREVRYGLRKSGRETAAIASAIDQLADDVHEALQSLRLRKQYRSPAVILSLTGERVESFPHGDGAGAAGALGQGTKFLAGLGGAHEITEYDAARARDGGAA